MTELMKRYLKETGESIQIRGTLMGRNYVAWLETKVLDEKTIEKFQEIIRNQCDEISALKDQLRWRPVSNPPKENVSVEVCDLSKSSLDEREPEIGYYENGEWFCIFPYDFNICKKITPTHWRYIPPAPEGEAE